MNITALKRRTALIIAGLFPVISGMLWGGFWLNAIAGMEDLSSGFALLAVAYAAGVIFSRIPGINLGRIAIWCIAFYLYVDLNLLFPMAFYFGMEGVSRKRDRNGGRFVSGFLSGGLLSGCFGFSLFMMVLLGLVQFVKCAGKNGRPLTGKWQRIGVKIFNGIALLAVLVMAFFSFKVRERISIKNPGASDITMLCALGSSANPDARMLSVSRVPERKRSLWFELIRIRVERVSPAKRISGNYDVIIIEDIPSDAFNSPRRYLASLADDGILVMPTAMCSKIPELEWRTIPGEYGAANSYAAAKKSGEFVFSGDAVEQNLLHIAAESEGRDLLLPGVISGGLVGFVSQPPENDVLLPREDFRYFLFGVAALLIALEILFRNSSFKESLHAAQCAFAFALIAGVLLSENAVSGVVEGGWLLALFAGSIIFLQLSARNAALRWMLVMASVLTLVWFFMPCFYTALAALLFSGLALAFSMRHYLYEHPGSPVDWQSFIVALAFACGIFAGGSMPGMVMEVLLTATGIYAWLFVRS